MIRGEIELSPGVVVRLEPFDLSRALPENPHGIISRADELPLATRVADKLGLRPRSDIVRFAVQMGLLTPQTLEAEESRRAR